MMSSEVKPRQIKYEDRRRLRRIIKWALRRNSWRSMTNREGTFREWASDKLNCLVAYGMSDLFALPNRAVAVVREHYCNGIPLEILAMRYGVSPKMLGKEINLVIDRVIDDCPIGLLASISRDVTQWRLKECKHCRGDLFWDAEGAYGAGGDYVCMACGRRHDAWGNLR